MTRPNKSIMLWVGENLSLGGLLRHSGRALGRITNVTLKGVGTVISQLPKESTNRERIKQNFDSVGQTLDTALTKGSAVVGNGLNKTIQTVSIKVGEAAGAVARKAGASEENIVVAAKIGQVACAATVGLVAGAGIAHVAVAFAAASGTAGAAATSSGLAGVGGGAIAAGGGGMAAGQAVTQGIATVSTFSGAASLGDDVAPQKIEK